VEGTGYPAIVRPSFTLGGRGAGTAYNVDEFREVVENGLARSPVHSVLVERSLIGWKEFELEVMRDRADNCVVICSIENFDPMGVHTGDSITVAPAQTLTDREYQVMRDAAFAVIREVGVETGGSNIQFAVCPETGRQLVIEMNPRVSRSSALASKATGFPIAKIAALLAVGYTLDEIPNDITRETPASFEPTIDYVVTKIPRWAFEKFRGSEDTLGTMMRSVGEAMAIGRTFKESFQKALRSLETGRTGFGPPSTGFVGEEDLEGDLKRPSPRRVGLLYQALRQGMGTERIAELSGIDPWFLEHLRQLLDMEDDLRTHSLEGLPDDLLHRAKSWGFSDRQLADYLGAGEGEVRSHRLAHGRAAVFKRVDTCGAEFEAHTPYLYSTHEEECEANPTDREKVMILGSGPNRIGQGLEFDYCCVHAALALKEAGFETIMVNCNPETVSTDYDTSDRLYFEPLTFEDVMSIVEKERPMGVIVQFGGQTPLNLAMPLKEAGVPILGTSPDSIDIAEDRERFGSLLNSLGARAPDFGTARSEEAAVEAAERVGYPVVVRPSYVLGGRAMVIVYDEAALRRYMREAVEASPEHPILVDHFLEDAFEVDVDAVADGERVVVAGIMQHIEEAGIHSGDSACVLPPFKISQEDQERMREITRDLALRLEVRGLLNIQFAIKDDEIYVLEMNPRASRTVPFVSKATGVPWARVASLVTVGRDLASQGVREVSVPATFVKESVFPWNRFPGVDPLLGPEMRSTGEVMGVARRFGAAFAKGQASVGIPLPDSGTAFLSVNDHDKENTLPIARGLQELGFGLVATKGTAAFLQARGLACEEVYKVKEGRPNVADRMVNGEIQLVVNTPLGKESFYDETAIRKTATQHGIPMITTLSGAAAAVEGIRVMRKEALQVRSLQELHSGAGHGAGSE